MPRFHDRTITCYGSRPSTTRLATEDDGPTLLELLHRYEPVRIEQGHLLMKVVPDAPEAELKPLSRRTFKFRGICPGAPRQH